MSLFSSFLKTRSFLTRGYSWLLILALAGLSSASTGVEKQGTLSAQDIVDRLKKGGLVVYFRHAKTDRDHEDQHPVNLQNCATQRNLSATGKEQALQIGKSFKRLGIPVMEVVSSPFCRCKDTAKLAFGEYKLHNHLYFAVALSKEQRAEQTMTLRRLLSTRPEHSNRIIVSHTSNLREATGKWPKPEGAAFVFEPLPGNKFSVLGMIAPDEWINLK